MIIAQTAFQAPVSRANGQTPPPAAPPTAEEPGERIDAFYAGTSNTAKWMSRIDGVVLGGVLGLAIGVALTAGGSGSGLAALALGAGGAAGGYVAFDKLSAFGGKIGRGADEQCPARGEAIGRVGANVALSLLGGNWQSAATNVAIPLVGGAISYALAEQK